MGQYKSSFRLHSVSLNCFVRGNSLMDTDFCIWGEKYLKTFPFCKLPWVWSTVQNPAAFSWQRWHTNLTFTKLSKTLNCSFWKSRKPLWPTAPPHHLEPHMLTFSPLTVPSVKRKPSSCRVSQLGNTGPCVFFTAAFRHNQVWVTALSMVLHQENQLSDSG